jgi:hypothetical protein
MAEFTCPIWGSKFPAERLEGTFEGGLRVRSPRTDGEYRISGTAIETIRQMSDEEKARLTTWIVDQRRSGVSCPSVTTHIMDEVKQHRPLRFSEKKRRFALFAIDRRCRPGTILRTAGTQDDQYRADTGAIAAWTECRDDAERSGLVHLFVDEDIVRKPTDEFVQLTSQGYELMEAVETGGAPTKQAFVAMWFDPTMNEAASAIENAIKDAGFTPRRIDKKEHNQKIDDEIVAEIRASRFVVADFTCGFAEQMGRQVAVARGGVYYEAGFAQGLRTPVIWTCRADCIDHVHFDTRQFNHIVWTEPTDLREALATRIRAIIV